jgi:hypothetical protein
MKSPINRRLSDDGVSETISLFLIVCRLGNLNCQFGWLRGSPKRKNLLVAEAYCTLLAPRSMKSAFANLLVSWQVGVSCEGIKWWASCHRR